MRNTLELSGLAVFLGKLIKLSQGLLGGSVAQAGTMVYIYIYIYIYIGFPTGKDGGGGQLKLYLYL